MLDLSVVNSLVHYLLSTIQTYTLSKEQISETRNIDDMGGVVLTEQGPLDINSYLMIVTFLFP